MFTWEDEIERFGDKAFLQGQDDRCVWVGVIKALLFVIERLCDSIDHSFRLLDRLFRGPLNGGGPDQPGGVVEVAVQWRQELEFELESVGVYQPFRRLKWSVKADPRRRRGDEIINREGAEPVYK